MTAFASDAFTDTAGTALGTHDANWLQVTGFSNVARTDGDSIYPIVFGTALYYYNVSPPSADYSVSADVVVLSGSGPTTAGPAGRMSTSAATFYHARFNSTAGAWQLFKSVGGTLTQLGSDVSDTLTAGNSYNCRLEMIGTTIKLYAKGSPTATISVTDSSITAAGFAGFRINQGSGSTGGATGLHLDNFSADPIASAGTLKTVNGLAIASVKTAQSLAKASMKTYNGLTP